jgi:hypothetical protein
MEFPGNPAIEHVGHAGDRQNDSGQGVFPGLVGSQIDVHIYGNQCQPEQTQQIGDIQNVFFPVFHGFSSVNGNGIITPFPYLPYYMHSPMTNQVKTAIIRESS